MRPTDVMPTFVLLLVVGFALGFVVGRLRMSASENQGEGAVRRLLTQRFPGCSYHLMNNITLPFRDGTTQIDHILLSAFGVFVIESKHYTGWLFADARSSSWTQVIYKKKSKFQNPLHQNAMHVQAVHGLLSFLPAEKIHNLVVFTGDAEFKKGRPPGVFDLNGLVGYIQQFAAEVIPQPQLEFAVGRLECWRRLVSGKTDVEHQAYLRRKFGEAR